MKVLGLQDQDLVIRPDLLRTDLQGGNLLTVHPPRVRLNLTRKRRRSEEQPTRAVLAANEEDERSAIFVGCPCPQTHPGVKVCLEGLGHLSNEFEIKCTICVKMITDFTVADLMFFRICFKSSTFYALIIFTFRNGLCISLNL